MTQSLHSAYVANGMRGNAFLVRGAGDLATRAARVREAAGRPLSPAILRVLVAQNEALGASRAREQHLNTLARGGAAMVVTGQQVGLCLGPLYTLYKAAAAVAWARLLSEETGVACVPAFWLQTEDHDFAEVGHCCVATDDGPVEVALAPAPERVSLAQCCLGADVEGALAAVALALGGTPHADETMTLLRAHYRPGVTMARAFAGVLTALFADDGLLVFDPRHAEVARAAAPVIATAFSEVTRIDAALAQRGRELTREGFVEQIAPRPLTSLAFFHVGEATGPRYRLGLAGDSLCVPGQAMSVSEALALLERDPLRFSTSALLRPIVQDALLPTALYVGGPAEVNYFGQASALYPIFGLPPPMVALRARLRLVLPRVGALLDKLAVTTRDLDDGEDVVREKLVAGLGTVLGPSEAWLSEVEERLTRYAASEVGADLQKAIGKTRGTLRRAVAALQRKSEHRVLEREAIVSQRLARVASWLRPGGQAQERVHSFMAYSARVGVGALMQAIRAAVRPLNPQPQDVML